MTTRLSHYLGASFRPTGPMPGSFLRHLELEPSLNPCADQRLAESLQATGRLRTGSSVCDVLSISVSIDCLVREKKGITTTFSAVNPSQP